MRRFFVRVGRAILPAAAFQAASRRPNKPLFSAIEIVRGIIDELSDQNAYRRHLIAHGATHSADEWRKFSDEHYRAKSTRPRCC
jgi:hypothetical protein